MFTSTRFAVPVIKLAGFVPLFLCLLMVSASTASADSFTVNSITPNEGLRTPAPPTHLIVETANLESTGLVNVEFRDPVTGLKDNNITVVNIINSPGFPLGTRYEMDVLINSVALLGLRDMYFQNGVGESVLKKAAFTVVPNSPPVLDPIGNKSVNEGQNLSFTVHATDPNGQTVTYSLQPVSGSLPSGISFNTTTGVFSWTPSYTQSGNYGLIFGASDGGLTGVEQITVTVNNVSTGVGSTTPRKHLQK